MLPKNNQLPLPNHYHSQQAFDPNYNVTDVVALQKLAEDFRRQYQIMPAGNDHKIIRLLAIDEQFDFIFPQGGALPVTGRSGRGAMEDLDRLAKFVYTNLHRITSIIPTMDTHLPFQIFFPIAHMRKDGSQPEPNTVILAEQYRQGEYQVNPAMARQLNVSPVWLNRQFTHYCEQLEKTGKYALYLWNYHCLLGSNGHRLAGVMEQLRLFHTFARGADNIPEIKGGNPLTENYSVFSPEVRTTWEGKPIPGAQPNTKLIKTLLESHAVIIAGQASSHCVKESIADFLKEVSAIDKNLVKKVYILRDCMSSVVIPNVVDFTDQAENALAEFAQAGMHVVNSTDPLESWPDINL